MKHQRKPVGGSTDPQVQTSAIRQPNMIKSVHATILAFRHDHSTVRPLPQLPELLGPLTRYEWLAAHIPGVEARLLGDDGHLTLLQRYPRCMPGYQHTASAPVSRCLAAGQ